MKSGYRAQATYNKALGHPARLQILDALTHGEACVCHLTTLLKQRQPYVSQQLMILRDGGFVLDRREGSTVYYRLADARVAALVTLSRELMRERDPELVWPPVPNGPLAGCPCPHCGGPTCGC